MGLTDLDDLVNKCRDKRSQKMLKEAVACFHVGAYRACIVSTWIAVVFDYLGKLGELSLTGNGQAKDILGLVEKAREDHDVKVSLKAESDLVETASKIFDLLSPIESMDLKRLFEDRNRCAHPSQIGADEAYEPTAELARTHLKHAVEHMLSRPPLQGAKEWDRIWRAIDSPYFPTQPDLALSAIREVLVRPRSALCTRVVGELLNKSVYADAITTARYQAALAAVLVLYPVMAQEAVGQILPKIAVALPDDRLPSIIFMAAHFDWVWPNVGDTVRGKIQSFLAPVLRDEEAEVKSGDAIYILEALKIDALRGVAEDRLQRAWPMTLVWLVRASQGPEVLDEIARRFTTKIRFRETMRFRELLRAEDVRDRWTTKQLHTIVEAAATNPEVKIYTGYGGLLRDLIKLPKARENIALWRQIYDEATGETTARKRIREAFPEFPAPETDDDGSPELPPAPSTPPGWIRAEFGPEGKPVEDFETGWQNEDWSDGSSRD